MEQHELITANAPPGVSRGVWEHMKRRQMQANREPTQADLEALTASVERYERQQQAQRQAIVGAVSQAVAQYVVPVVRQVAELERQQAMRERHQAGLRIHSQQPQLASGPDQWDGYDLNDPEEV